MSITVSQIGFAYHRGEPVLDGVTAEAPNGRITAVIGPNAAGKSTLLRLCIGALRPRSGRALVDGTDAVALRGRRLAERIAYVPQRASVAAAFTVREVVELGRYALPRDRRRVEDAIERMGLRELADRPYPELSVGQQQRVTLARALAQVEPPGNLVLDEPTSAMDLRHARRCFDVLRDLAQRGAAILVAMHDLTAAAALADDAWLIESGPPGRLNMAGAAEAVMQPQRLEAIFGVPFEWLERPGARRVLLPLTRAGS